MSARRAVPERGVFYVTRLGSIRLGAFPLVGNERDRAAMRDLLAKASPPPICSTAIPVAPARGAMAVFRDVETVMTPNGPRQRLADIPTGAAARVASALDLIELAARGRERGALFTPAQHAAAAEYEALFERVNSGRVKCSSLQAGAGGGAGTVIDAIVDDIARLRAMDARIGRAPVLSPRDATAMPGRSSVRTNDLMRWAIVGRKPLSRLLLARGWACQSRYLKTLRTGLAGVLDAIYGF